MIFIIYFYFHMTFIGLGDTHAFSAEVIDVASCTCDVCL
jgi:hypothetical protein